MNIVSVSRPVRFGCRLAEFCPKSGRFFALLDTAWSPGRGGLYGEAGPLVSTSFNSFASSDRLRSCQLEGPSANSGSFTAPFASFAPLRSCLKRVVEGVLPCASTSTNRVARDSSLRYAPFRMRNQRLKTLFKHSFRTRQGAGQALGRQRLMAGSAVMSTLSATAGACKS
jgi:hypothetical protein